MYQFSKQYDKMWTLLLQLGYGLHNWCPKLGLNRFRTRNADVDINHRALPFTSRFSHVPGMYDYGINSLRPRQKRRHLADDIFKCIFLNENVWIPINISLKFVPKGWINNIPALVQIMAWRRPGDKPLSEPMMVSLPTHICVTRPQWVKKVT